MLFSKKPANVIDKASALGGRADPMEVAATHFVSNVPLKGPYLAQAETIYFGMGCFWGAEKIFWQLEGVFVSAVGYQGGFTPNPNYGEVCSGKTGHTESVMVVYDPEILPLPELLKVFWEGHDPTQGMAQGNDVGTQYRSAIYTTNTAQMTQVMLSHEQFGDALDANGRGIITTEIAPAKTFYFAEIAHQQYLAKNPGGYCGLGGTGVICPVPQA